MHPNITERTIKIFGLSEAEIAKKLESEPLGIPDVSVSVANIFPEVHLRLRATELTTDLMTACHLIAEKVGKQYVVSDDSEISFAENILNILRTKKVSISFAESCTGGLISAMITDIPGSSEHFAGAIVSYSNESKIRLLEVDSELIENDGAVSSSVAAAMARGARKRFQTHYAVSVTGIAGPTGGSTEKPVGTFYVGLACNKGISSYKFFHPSTRQEVRTYAAYAALNVLRCSIFDFSIPQ